MSANTRWCQKGVERCVTEVRLQPLHLLVVEHLGLCWRVYLDCSEAKEQECIGGATIHLTNQKPALLEV